MTGSPCTGTTADPGEWEKITCATVNGVIQVSEIDLNGNNLVGSLPTTLGRLTTMTRNLKLGSNKLTGSIPTEIGGITAIHQVLDLSKNSLSGPIPSEIGVLTLLTQVHSTRVKLKVLFKFDTSAFYSRPFLL